MPELFSISANPRTMEKFCSPGCSPEYRQLWHRQQSDSQSFNYNINACFFYHKEGLNNTLYTLGRPADFLLRGGKGVVKEDNNHDLACFFFQSL